MSLHFDYYSEPGIIQDILKMLYVKLNPNNVWKEVLTPADSQNTAIQYIQQYSELFAEVKSELALFFYIPTNKHATFMTSALEPFLIKDFSHFNLDCILNYLNDIEKVRSDLYSYFLNENISNPGAFENAIRCSKYITDRIKLHLFGFSYNPNLYITSLRKAFITYHDFIKEKWPSSPLEEKVLNDFVKVINNRNRSSNNPQRVFTSDNISYSLCRCTPNFFVANYSSEHEFFITTFQTLNQRTQNTSFQSRISLLQSLHALDDSHRLSILDLIKKNNSLSVTDISKKLELSITATKYHISLLKKGNFLNLTKIGRTSYYSVNPIGYQNLINILQNHEKEI